VPGLWSLGGIDQCVDVVALLAGNRLARLGAARVMATHAGLGDPGAPRQPVRLDLVALVGDVSLARPVTLLASCPAGGVFGDAPFQDRDNMAAGANARRLEFGPRFVFLLGGLSGGLTPCPGEFPALPIKPMTCGGQRGKECGTPTKRH